MCDWKILSAFRFISYNDFQLIAIKIISTKTLPIVWARSPNESILIIFFFVAKNRHLSWFMR